MPKRPTVLAYALFGFALVLAGVAVVGAVLVGLDRETLWSYYLITNTVIGLSAAPCGLLIARGKPDNPIGWLFLIFGIAPLLTAAVTPLMIYGAEHDWPQFAKRMLVTIYSFSWQWGVGCFLPLILQLFPTGKPVGRHWHVLVWLTVANSLLGTMFIGPTPEVGASSFLLAPWWAVTESISGNVGFLIMFASIASLVVRFVRGAETVRQQVLWLLAAVILVMLIMVPTWFSIPSGGTIVLLLSFPLIPAAVTIAVLRHGLYDVRIVVSRLVVYGLLTAGVIAIYIGLVTTLDRVLRGVGAPVVAALAIALAFNPVRVRLQRLVDRAVYGTRRDPVAAVSAVGQRLAGDDLGGVADALRDTLRLSYVAIQRQAGGIVESGERPATTHTQALIYDSEPIGNLIVGPRPGERQLSRADQRVIDVELIGEASTGREAIKAAVINKPDVIIMDLAMPEIDGFSATAEINRVAPEVAVLVLTMSDDDITMTKAMRAGARGYLLKGATKEEILRAVTAVADGQAIFGPAIAQRVLARLGATSADEDPFPQLTPREHDVLGLLAQGLSNSAIADRLGLSLKTVNNNTSSIFTKLNVATRTEAAIMARDRGLGQP